MSDYDKSLHGHDKKKKKMESRKAASEEVRLKTTAKNRQQGCNVHYNSWVNDTS